MQGSSEYPSHQSERKLGVRFRPSPAAEVRGDITVHASVRKLDAHLGQHSGTYDLGTVADGHAVHQPRMTLGKEGKAVCREGHDRFAAARDAGAKVVPVSVDPKSAGKFHKAYGVGEPSLAVYHSELQEEAQGQPDR